MNLNAVVSKFITNKWVLNIISLFALFNIIGYMIMGKLNSVMFFIILAALARNFSKNMIIVLGTPLVIVNLFAMRNGSIEGLANNSGETDSENTNITRQILLDMMKKLDDDQPTAPATTATTATTAPATTAPAPPAIQAPPAEPLAPEPLEPKFDGVSRGKKGGSTNDYAGINEDNL
jgi:hypothetical protein